MYIYVTQQNLQFEKVAYESLPPKDGSFPFFYGESLPNEDLTSSFLF